MSRFAGGNLATSVLALLGITIEKDPAVAAEGEGRLARREVNVTVLMQVPVSDAQGAAVILVEADPDDIPGGLTLAATPEPGKAMATAARSLSESLDQIAPLIQTVKDKLVASAPEHFVVEFGVKLGGEAGIILAKGTAEVNLTITMSWERDPESRRLGSEPGRDR